MSALMVFLPEVLKNYFSIDSIIVAIKIFSPIIVAPTVGAFITTKR